MYPQLPAPDSASDPHLWLEEITSAQALEWVNERNDISLQQLHEKPLAKTLEGEILSILDAKDKIPFAHKRGDYLYVFWQDEDHERGVWQRTTLDSYRSDNPDWDVLIDVDALNEQENEDWVWHGASALRPRDGKNYTRFLVSLSHGGSDADVTREWDLESRSFVADGFNRPEAKGGMSWVDYDTVLVATDFGEDTLTTSGYPRQVRLWRRGEELAKAQKLYESSAEDMGVFAAHVQSPGFERTVITNMHTFYTSTTFVVTDLQTEPKLQEVNAPKDVQVSLNREQIIFMPRTDWQFNELLIPAGAVAVGNIDDYLNLPPAEVELKILFNPSDKNSLQNISVTKNYLILTVLEDVKYRLEAHWLNGENWHRSELFKDLTGSLEVWGVDSDENDEIWLTQTDFTTPTSLYLGDIAGLSESKDAALELLKQTPARFDASDVVVKQYFATSDDGTKVPYFEVAKEATSAPRPTLLYGYGGFEVSLTANYLPVSGKAWIERGGVYVIANIRGGGEYGPKWHQAGLKANRPKVYQDMAAVARDLVARGVTTEKQLGVQGGSNGGLLTGNMLTQYPELFGAVIIQVPLLDMKRFSKLLAGASWMGEYGDPDTADWDFIKTFSPYHLIDESAAESYPPVFVLTSTRDDRVHPGHARKFTAALESVGAEVLYYENIEGGHGGAASNKQAARMNSLIYAFLWEKLSAQ